MAKVFLHDQTNRIVGSIEANGRITVTCPSGYNVKATCGEIVHTAVSNETGRVIFTGLSQGEWTIDVSDGEQTVSKNVEVITDYELDVDFITAEIRIDYPYGSICTCTNGVVTHNAPDEVGHWDCIVADRGIWTVTCTNGIRTETRTVEITNDGQVEDVEIIFFEASIKVTVPLGSVTTCTNGIVTYNGIDHTGFSSPTFVETFIIPEPGRWTVTCVKDAKTETRIFDILVDGQMETVTIEFFEATLDITYTAGYPCICQMGDIKLIAPDKSGHWVCTIPDSGTWTVSCSNGELVKSENIDMTTNGESKSVDIDYFLAVIDVLYPGDTWCEITYDGTPTYDNSPSGKWVFEAPHAGSYTVKCATDSGSKTKTVYITDDWQVVYVNLTEFMANINVAYPAGSECTCSDGSTTYRATNSAGNWTFTVPRANTWTIIAKNSEQEASSRVVITSDGQNENVTIKFFEATIEIAYPAGTICTCTDGISSYQASSTSGRWILTVPRAGEWLIRAIDGNRNVSESVIVEYDGQTISKTIEFFEAYIDVTYPSGSYKIILYSVDPYGSETELATDTSGSGSHMFTVYKESEYKIAAYRVEPTVGIESDSGKYTSAVYTITSSSHKRIVNVTLKFCSIPEFIYSGRYEIVADYGYSPTNAAVVAEDILEEEPGEGTLEEYVISEAERDGWYGDWNIKFLESGVLKFTKLNGAYNGIDVFLCGGGGNGGNMAAYDASDDQKTEEYKNGGGGGGGGYRDTSFGETVDIGKSYAITVGGAGGASQAFGVTASGGNDGGDGSTTSQKGGTGGTGGSSGGKGAGGDDIAGSNGEDGSYAFIDSDGMRYGPGGGGGGGYWSVYWYADDDQANRWSGTYNGGVDGGGSSVEGYSYLRNGAANSGGGGCGGGVVDSSGGMLSSGGTGGSGIVIIRNAR